MYTCMCIYIYIYIVFNINKAWTAVGVAASVACLVLYLVLLPLVTADRLPFQSFLGCPSGAYLVFAGYASCVAFAGICMYTHMCVLCIYIYT